MEGVTLFTVDLPASTISTILVEGGPAYHRGVGTEVRFHLRLFCTKLAMTMPDTCFSVKLLSLARGEIYPGFLSFSKSLWRAPRPSGTHSSLGTAWFVTVDWIIGNLQKVNVFHCFSWIFGPKRSSGLILKLHWAEILLAFSQALLVMFCPWEAGVTIL